MFHLRESDRGWLYGLATEVLVGAVFPPGKMTVWRFARTLVLRVAVVEFMHRFRQRGEQLEQDASDHAHRVMAERLEEIRAEPWSRSGSTGTSSWAC